MRRCTEFPCGPAHPYPVPGEVGNVLHGTHGLLVNDAPPLVFPNMFVLVSFCRQDRATIDTQTKPLRGDPMGSDPYDGTIDDLAARVQVLERDVGTMRGILWPRDLWTLSTGERVLAFVGAGCLLLACSLMYHRFRDMILEAVSQ